jgi:acyl-CoA reductase-like NAD-dependent aldehyde dehydrogenase
MTGFEQENFGPVVAITIADDVEHAIELANASDYGLGGHLCTADTARAKRIARRLETGGVFINGFSASNTRIPVGGVKKSGYGRELSRCGLRELTTPKRYRRNSPASPIRGSCVSPVQSRPALGRAHVCVPSRRWVIGSSGRGGG